MISLYPTPFPLSLMYASAKSSKYMTVTLSPLPHNHINNSPYTNSRSDSPASIHPKSNHTTPAKNKWLSPPETHYMIKYSEKSLYSEMSPRKNMAAFSPMCIATTYTLTSGYSTTTSLYHITAAPKHLSLAIPSYCSTLNKYTIYTLPYIQILTISAIPSYCSTLNKYTIYTLPYIQILTISATPAIRAWSTYKLYDYNIALYD